MYQYTHICECTLEFAENLKLKYTISLFMIMKSLYDYYALLHTCIANGKKKLALLCLFRPTNIPCLHQNHHFDGLINPNMSSVMSPPSCSLFILLTTTTSCHKFIVFFSTKPSIKSYTITYRATFIIVLSR